MRKVLSTKVGISDVEYSFRIRGIRENTFDYSLLGADGISVRISKEDFEFHKVTVGKILVYDGHEYYCQDQKDIYFKE